MTEHPHPLKNQLLERMNFALYKMEETGEIDLGFLSHVTEFRHHIDKVKARWLENSNTEGFYFYLAARSIELILGRMQERFQEAGKAHDNPAVAPDTLALLPEFDKTLDLLAHDEITPESIDAILDRTRVLRDVAEDKNLLESIETDLESVDADRFRLLFPALIDQLSVELNLTTTDLDDE